MNIVLLVVILVTWFLMHCHQQSDNGVKLRYRSNSKLSVLKSIHE